MSAVPSLHPPTPPTPSPWDALPSPVLLLAHDGSALEINRAFVAFTGLAAEAFHGRGWLVSVAAAAQPALLAALQQPKDFGLALQMLRLNAPDVVRPAWVDLAAQWDAGHGHHVCVLHDISAARRAEIMARSQAEQFRLLADNVPALIAYYRAADNLCLFANKQYAQTFGWDERSIVGRHTWEVIGDAAWQQVQPKFDVVLRERRSVAYERQLTRPDGQPQWIEVHLLPHLDADGAAIACFVLISDITKHRLAEQAVRESEERLGKFMQASCEGIVFHKDGFITDANAPACALLGYALDELLGRRTLEFVAPERVAQVSAVITARLETAYESVVIDKAGQRIPVEFIVRTMLHEGETMRMTIVRDLRDRHAALARIHHLAHHDALTGLPNRMAFMDQLDHLMGAARAADGALALLFIDLDHFKRVNDSLGHLVGDLLLQTVTARITDCLRTDDCVARFGGDEFMVLLTGVTDRAVVEQVAGKLLAAIEAPLDVGGRPISVSPSIGVALFPEHGRTPAELIQHADAAMYQAKARGRATIRFFDPDLASAAYDALVIEGQLSQALATGAFELHYQPQLRARDGRLVGVEALIRWHHPERGLLLPDDFIPVAEQRRLMLPIGHWVLREALRTARGWHAGGLTLPVSVNLSSMQFQQRGFVDGLAQLLEQEQASGGWLELELTERMLMEDLDEVKAVLGRIRALGIRISVDDFGTGYFSLGHLKELPIDKVKIDRSFVQDLPGSPDACAIARAIVQLGHSLELVVVAEGVETQAQEHFLRELGCDELQGLLISAPLTSEALQRWAARRLR